MPTSPGRMPPRQAEETVFALQEQLAALGITGKSLGHTGSRVRLPLHYFDNTDVERMTPEAHVAAATERFDKKANAALLQPAGADAEGWQLGRVDGYDGKAGAFVAHLVGVDGRVDESSSVLVPRLSVLFLHESVPEFAQRLSAAHHARDEAEADILFQFYVRNMPTTDVYTLSDAQIERLIERAVPAHRMPAAGAEALARSGSVAPLIAEVKLSYAHSMNSMLLREGLQRAPLKDKVRGDLLLPPPRAPAPELGVVAEAKGLDYALAAESFGSISSLALSEACHAVVAARHECIQLARLGLFNVELERTLSLEDFDALQVHTY